MKVLIASLVISLSIAATAKDVFISIPTEHVAEINFRVRAPMSEVFAENDLTVLKVSEDTLVTISDFMHHKFNRCGGFITFDNLEDAKGEARSSRAIRSNLSFADYSINAPAYLVDEYITQVDEFQIRSTIEHLSSYKNRFYKSDTGVEAANWIAENWRSFSSHRSDVTVELYEHSGWAQPSVIATIQGTSDEVVIIGGHLDSIAGWFGGNHVDAPGADDNASGIATITEIFRVLIENGYTPEKTLKFMGYAAEEVGLRGSAEIAADYASSGINVVGVMQLDMTNFKGSEKLIYLIDDFTNQAQNEFLGSLIDTYLGITWDYSRCGYACSDHASWHRQDFPASFPFEAAFNGSNSQIHTARDKIDVSGGNADHASNFAKLGLAFILELDN